MNGDEASTSGSRASLAAGAVAYGVVYVLLLPGRVLVFNDDFAYLRSIQATLSAGRLYTDEFLEPFSALLSLLSSLFFLSTDNFYLSTYGLLAASAMLNYFLVYRLFSNHLAPTFNAVLSFSLCTAPIYLGKSLEFGAVNLFVNLFLAALLLYPRRGKVGFFVVTFLAFSLRQTGILLLALPVYDLLEHFARRRSIDWGGALQVAATGAACLALALLMNPTFARELNTDRLFFEFDLVKYLTKVELGLLLSLAFVSTWHFFLHRFSSDWVQRERRQLAIPVVLSLMCAQVYWRMEVLVVIETPIATSSFDGWWLNEILSLWILVSIWVMDYSKIKPHSVLFLMGCWIGVLALRETLWDYYLMSLFVLSAVWVANLEPTPRRTLPKAIVALAVLLSLNLYHAYLFKEHLDRIQLQIEVYEDLLRKGRVEASELSGAPFGYLAWKFFDYYMANDARRLAEDRSTPSFLLLGSFLVYLQPNRIGMIFDDSRLREGIEVLAAGKRRLGLRVVEWKVVRLEAAPAQIPIRRERFEDHPYPLTNNEWSKLLDAGG
jgi:hypothetical protein